MAYEIVKGPKSRVMIRVNGATSGLVINLADVAANTIVAGSGAVSEETVTNLSISRVFWTTANTGYWKISRNTNSVLELGNSGFWNLMEASLSVANTSTGNIGIDLIGTNNGSLIIELAKEATYSPSHGQ
jgi:hypothetical protein